MAFPKAAAPIRQIAAAGWQPRQPVHSGLEPVRGPGQPLRLGDERIDPCPEPVVFGHEPVRPGGQLVRRRTEPVAKFNEPVVLGNEPVRKRGQPVHK